MSDRSLAIRPVHFIIVFRTELMWFFHVNSSSIITSRNFTNVTCLTKSLFILIVLSVFSKDLFFYLKITNFVLEALIDNLLALSHFTTLFISFCIVLYNRKHSYHLHIIRTKVYHYSFRCR